MTERLRDLSWCLCSVCGGEAAGAYGWAPKGGKPKVMCEWCWPLRHFGVREQLRSRENDQLARNHAGAQAGEYLESIGVTDIAVLSPDQWARFLDILFRAKQSELRRLFAPEAPIL